MSIALRPKYVLDSISARVTPPPGMPPAPITPPPMRIPSGVLPGVPAPAQGERVGALLRPKYVSDGGARPEVPQRLLPEPYPLRAPLLALPNPDAEDLLIGLGIGLPVGAGLATAAGYFILQNITSGRAVESVLGAVKDLFKLPT